ncbi:MAG: DNA mismatch repair protein MutS [Deltaproteobacteria bacterium]|nr:DNA mismatch repair protein MutS [Deltaproteobacteria bacterium]
MTTTKAMTPAMRQYLDIKNNHTDAIVFFRMGDFYEIFFDDARIAAKVMGIALTSRDKEKKIPMCGIPYHAADIYIGKLIGAGHKVAVCEQIEDPAEAKGVIRRAVTRVVTPGTIQDDKLLSSKTNNYIAAVTWSKKGGAGLAYMDITTGDFKLTDLEGVSSLRDELRRINPSEVLMPEGSPLVGVLEGLEEEFKNITQRSAYDFELDVAAGFLTSHFKVASLDGFGCGELTGGVASAGALLKYVSDMQKSSLEQIKPCSPYFPSSYLIMDYATRRNLEVIENARDRGRDSTLLAHMDRTKTSMGARLLCTYLIFPLLNLKDLKARLSATEELIEGRLVREDIEGELKNIFDIERLIGKISSSLATARDLVALKESLKRVVLIKDLLETFSSELMAKVGVVISSHEVEEVIELIAISIKETPALLLREGGFIRDGYNEELDELRKISGGGKDSIAAIEKKERERVGISSLKVGFNRVFGYYIEVTKANLASFEVPDYYVRKQTLVNAERFITPELKEWEEKVLTAEDKAIAIELKVFSGIIRAISEKLRVLQRVAEHVAILDVTASFAELAEEMRYVKPVLSESDVIEIKEGRHPVVEAGLPEGFTPNDIKLDRRESRILILTGPNMAGKSTYIRQVAVIVLMAQVGSFVPAMSAHIGIVDRIFTRVGASDDMSKGQSTFMVEMNEAANILNNATDKSLVILDEIGRGTSTFDGLSIAWAVVEYLHDTEGRRAKTLFATHYHELTDISLTKKRVKNYNMAVKEWEDDIIFLKKVIAGSTNRSYGIHVARLAGLPKSVVARATEILKNLECGELNEAGMPNIAGAGKAKTMKLQPSLPHLFSKKDDPIRQELRDVDINSLSPLEALNKLNRIKELLDD